MTRYEAFIDRNWESREELEAFMPNLLSYWNNIADLLAGGGLAHRRFP